MTFKARRIYDKDEKKEVTTNLSHISHIHTFAHFRNEINTRY